MKRCRLITSVIILTFVMVSCVQNNTAEKANPVSTTTATPSIIPPSIKLEYDSEQKLNKNRLETLYGSFVGTILFEAETDLPDARQVFYRDTAAELPNLDIYSFIEINGIDYALGKVGYGDASVFPNMAEQLAFSLFAGILSQTDTQMFTQYKFAGAKNDSIGFYVIKNGAPTQVAEITGVIDYSDVDGDGIDEVVSSDHGAMAEHITISKFDAESGLLRQANIAELLGVDSVACRESLWFTQSIDMATSASREGYIYRLSNGKFVPIYAPLA